jgi:hypothetical protein
MTAVETPVRPRQLPVVAAAPAAAPAPALVTMGEDVVLRKSNEVEGFRYSRLKGIWFTITMFLKLPLFPLWPFFIAWMVKDSGYAKRYFHTLAYCFKVLIDQVRFGSAWRMVRYNVFMTPESVEKRINLRRGACSRCAKCCKQFDCLFLGQQENGDYICKVYGTDYWYYGTCGRYPLEQIDIDYHACPGFSFPESDRQAA